MKSAILFNDTEIKTLIEYAEAHRLDTPEIIRRIKNGGPEVGDDKNHVLYGLLTEVPERESTIKNLPCNLRIVYSIEQVINAHGSTLWARHISMSAPVGRLPGPRPCWEVAKRLGFWGEIDLEGGSRGVEFGVCYLEDALGADVTEAVNIIQLYDKSEAHLMKTRGDEDISVAEEVKKIMDEVSPESVDHAPYKCTGCGNVLEGGFEATGKGGRPGPGSISVCGYCGELAKFDEELNLHHLTDEDIAKIGEPEKTIMLAAQAVAKKNKKQ